MEIAKPEVTKTPNCQQSEVAVGHPVLQRKRRHIRLGTYDLKTCGLTYYNDEDNVNKMELNDTVAKDFVVTKKPRKSSSPKPNVRKLKSSIPCPRRKNAPSSLVKKPAVKSIISRTPNFTRIHEKAFSKMDSIDKFLQKKQQRSAMLLKSPLSKVAIQSIQKENKSVSTASKIPKFGMPTKPLDFSFGKVAVEGKIFKFSAGSLIPRLILHPKVTTLTFGNLPLKKEEVLKFSAKPSTHKVAVVKPRTMKTLSENPQAFRSKDFSLHKIRQEKEKQEIIKGVRSNKRFELQMKNRAVILK